jgi:uncharacterized protein
VTGASAGIGAAFAKRLAEGGYDLVIVARDRPRLEAQARDLRVHGADVTVAAADLTAPGDLESIEKTLLEGPPLDLLVNNAGFSTAGRFHELDPAAEELEIRLNVQATVRLTHAALQTMVERGRGAVINLSSVAAFVPGPFTATYSATKAYIKSFTESLAEELRGTGVRVQVLCPGYTRTEFHDRAKLQTSHIPSAVWMSSDAVVDASLSALERDVVVCVPGFTNLAMVALTTKLPQTLIRLLSGRAARLSVRPKQQG